jgi:CRISPR-associated exonuclease Cas4
MSALLPVITLLLVLFGILLLIASRQMRQRTGLPEGEIIYQDTVRTTSQVFEALFSARYRLAGKPDYLVQEGSQIIPVEVKTGRPPIRPYDSHMMQLAAYCLLVEDMYGVRPPYGIIQYGDEGHSFRIPWTDELRGHLLGTLKTMRADLTAQDVPRSHSQAGRCRACSMHDFCDQALV